MGRFSWIRAKKKHSHSADSQCALHDDPVFLGRVLGRGSFASVSLAEDAEGGELVHRSERYATDDPFLEKRTLFLSEHQSKAIKRLGLPSNFSNPHAAQAETDIHSLHALEPGITFSQFLEKNWRKGPEFDTVALTLLFDILYQVQQCHVAGVIHNDLNPGNMMVYGQFCAGKKEYALRAALIDFDLCFVKGNELNDETNHVLFSFPENFQWVSDQLKVQYQEGESKPAPTLPNPQTDADTLVKMLDRWLGQFSASANLRSMLETIRDALKATHSFPCQHAIHAGLQTLYKKPDFLSQFPATLQRDFFQLFQQSMATPGTETLPQGTEPILLPSLSRKRAVFYRWESQHAFYQVCQNVDKLTFFKSDMDAALQASLKTMLLVKGCDLESTHFLARSQLMRFYKQLDQFVKQQAQVFDESEQQVGYHAILDDIAAALKVAKQGTRGWFTYQCMRLYKWFKNFSFPKDTFNQGKPNCTSEFTGCLEFDDRSQVLALKIADKGLCRLYERQRELLPLHKIALKQHVPQVQQRLAMHC